MRKIQQQQFGLLSLLVLILFFQNCTGGFNAFENEFGSGAQDQSSVSIADVIQPGSQTVPVLLYESAIAEMQGATVTFDGTEELTFPKGLPKGGCLR